MSLDKIILEIVLKELSVMVDLAEEDQEVHSWSRLKELKQQIEIVLKFFSKD